MNLLIIGSELDLHVVPSCGMLGSSSRDLDVNYMT